MITSLAYDFDRFHDRRGLRVITFYVHIHVWVTLLVDFNSRYILQARAISFLALDFAENIERYLVRDFLNTFRESRVYSAKRRNLCPPWFFINFLNRFRSSEI